MIDFDNLPCKEKIYWRDESTVIYCGDNRDILPLFPDKSIDLVLTDPPYLQEYMWAWEYLSEQSSRLLSETGYIASYSGGLRLPEILKGLTSHLNYRSTIAILHAERNFSWSNRIIDGWKPVFILSSHNHCKDEMRQNVMWPSSADKRFHEWGQVEKESLFLVCDYSKENDIILDPFMGSGTTLVASKHLNRKSIGIELSEAYCQIAVDRLRQQVMKI